MVKSIIKQKVGPPSLKVACRIEVSDKCSKLGAAHYRLTTRLRELEDQFEAKASELREAYLHECAAIRGDYL